MQSVVGGAACAGEEGGEPEGGRVTWQEAEGDSSTARPGLPVRVCGVQRKHGERRESRTCCRSLDESHSCWSDVGQAGRVVRPQPDRSSSASRDSTPMSAGQEPRAQLPLSLSCTRPAGTDKDSASSGPEDVGQTGRRLSRGSCLVTSSQVHGKVGWGGCGKQLPSSLPQRGAGQAARSMLLYWHWPVAKCNVLEKCYSS